MSVRGIGPIVSKTRAFWIFVAGTELNRGDAVEVTFEDTTRYGEVKFPYDDGALALINRDSKGKETKEFIDKEILDGDLVDVTVTVGSDSVTEPGASV
ncbi:MAG: hypothetical protein CL946_00730 [Ectothiorhodospiraceae bacterium]|nr:hypothetical protein [Ectothiorhodospiraceae bacterium]